MSRGIIENLIEELTKLPGIGRKTAQRLAFYILSMPAEEAKAIGKAIIEVKEKARFCSQCFNITDSELCEICSNPSRDRKRICVVEEPSNIAVIERTGVFKGLYHVLLGNISPLDGGNMNSVKLRELLERVSLGVDEVIIATNPNTRGELTAQYIRELLKPYGVKVTRIAYGLPMGSDIEFADEVTLGKALEGRREI
ncbi:MAG: recombination mediator RecR [Thermodesulfovibrionales bacterium]|nr:recombination mediator RecR [Thermodesulfovibrionales bacterium]